MNISPKKNFFLSPQAQDHQARLQEEEADAGGGGGQRRGLRAGAHVRVQAQEREGGQAPVEVRRRAPRLLQAEGAGQGPQRKAELLQNGQQV